MHLPLSRSYRIVLCLIFGSALCSFGGDTINFDSYTAATALNGQDGWVWHDISAVDNANDMKSVTFSGSDKVAACTTYGVGEQYRPVTSKSSTAELRWKWRADATTTKGAFGPCSTMSTTSGNWNDFRVRPAINGSGAFSCKGAAFAATAGWPTYGLNKWYYMRLYMNIATNKYSLYLDSVSFAGTTETLLVNDSTMAHTAGLAVSKVGFKGNTGIGGKIYIDSIMWSDPWTAAVVAKTWDGSSSANWNTAANWTGNTVPINNDTILFNSSSTANLSTTNDISSLTGLRIKVVDPTGAVSIGTNAIALGSNGIDMSAATQNLSISSNVTMGAAQTWNVASSKTLTVSGTVTNSTYLLTVDGAGNTTVSNVIGNGAGGITKNGTGTLTLSATNTYTGATAVTAGVVNVQNAQGTGTTAGGVTVSSGAALELQGGITVGAEALTLSGTGVSSNGALRNISGNNTWGGTITLNAATTIQSDADVLTLNAANAITATNQNLTIEGASGGTISGTITTGTGTLTKNDAGTWTLSGANTYSGTTTVSAGTLTLSNSSGSGTGTGGITINGGTLNGTGAASGAITLTTGILAGTQTFSGDLTGNGGTVSPAGASTVGTLTFTGGTGAVDLNSSCTYSANITGNATNDQLAVTGAVDITSSTLSLTLGYAPTIGHTYTIIANDDVDAITGTFTGLAEGAQTSADYSATTYYFTVSYAGGTGNDVVLTNSAAPSKTVDLTAVANGFTAAGKSQSDIWLGTATFTPSGSGSDPTLQTVTVTAVDNPVISEMSNLSSIRLYYDTENTPSTADNAYGSSTSFSGNTDGTATFTEDLTVDGTKYLHLFANTGASIEDKGVLKPRFAFTASSEGTGDPTTASTGTLFSNPTGMTLEKPVLTRIQRGRATIPGASTSLDVPVSTFDSTRSFLIISTTGDNGDADEYNIAGYVKNNTTLTFVRGTAGTIDMAVEWQLFEFASGVHVKHGSTSIAATSVSGYIGGEVDIGRSFVIGHRNKAGSTAFGTDDASSIDLISNDSVLVETNATNVSTVYWQVVQYDSCKVQKIRPSVSAGSASTATRIARVDSTKTMMLSSWRVGAAANADDMPRVELFNRDTVTCTRVGTTAQFDVVAFVVTFTDETNVQHGNITLSGGATTGSSAAMTVDTLAAGVIGPGHMQRGGSTDYATDDNTGYNWFVYDISSSGVDVLRGAGGTSSAVAPFQVVSFQRHAKIWDGSASTSWSGAANWTVNAAPMARDTVVFNSSSTANLSTSNDISGLYGLYIKQIDPSGAVTVAGTAFGTGSSGITLASATQNLTASANLTAESAQTWEVAADKTLTLSGTTTLTGAVTKSGSGTLTISGNNSGAGGVTLSAGTLNLGHNAALGTGTLTISGAGTITANSAGIAASNAVAANADFTVGGSNTLTLSGTMTLGANRQATVSNSATTTFSGQITGGAYSFTKAGDGTLVLSGTTSDYSGGTTISAGTLTASNASGSATGSGAVTINGGTLDGTGSASGAVTLTTGTLAGTLTLSGDLTGNGGTVSPAGASTVGTIALTGGAGAVDLNSGCTYSANITGDATCDQLSVTGAVDITSSTLSLTLGYAPTIGHTYTILANDATDAITGTFTGLAEGAQTTADYSATTYYFTVSYIGGSDNNDIVLTNSAAPAAQSDTVTFESGYTIGNTLDGQDGWVRSASEAANYIQIRQDGTNELARSKCGAVASHKRGFTSIATTDTLEIRWRWRAQSTGSYLAVGPMSDTTGGWYSWNNMRARLNMEAGSFNSKGANWVDRTGWPSYSANTWYYERAQFYGPTNKYSWWHATQSNRSDEVKLVNDSTMYGSAAAILAFRISPIASGTTDSIDVDDIMWRKYVVPPAKTWTGATNSSWNESGNWSPSGVPEFADSVVFAANAVACNLDINSVVNALSFGADYSGAFTFNASCTLSVGGSTADFRSGANIVTNTGSALQMTGTGAQTFIPRATDTLPMIIQNGTGGTTTVSTNPLLSDGAFIVKAGTIDLNDKKTTCTGFTGSGGTLTCGTDTLWIAGSADFSGLTALNEETGTVLVEAKNATITLTHDNETFYNLILYMNISSSGSPYFYIGAGTLTVTNDLIRWRTSTATRMYMDFETNSAGVTVGGDLLYEAKGSTAQAVYYKLGTGTWTIGGNANLINFNDGGTYSGASWVFNGSGTQVLSNYGSLTSLGSVTHSGSGTLQLSGATLQCASFSSSAGTIDLNSQNITTTGNVTITNGECTTFSNLAGRTVTAGGNISISGSEGSFANLNPASGATLAAEAGAGTVTVDWAVMGNITASGGGAKNATHTAVDNTNTGWTSVAGNIKVWDGGSGADNNWATVANWTNDAAPGTSDSVYFVCQSSDPCDLAASAEVKRLMFGLDYTGAFNFSSSTLTASGNADFRSGGDITPATGGLALTASSGTQVLIPRSGDTLPAITHSGAGTLQLSTNALVAKGVTQSAGVLDLNSLNITSVGNFTVSNGTTTTFSNLGGRTITVVGDAGFTGQSGNLLNINPASVWYVNATNNLTASYATVGNSNASGGVQGQGDANCTSSGGNTNWSLPGEDDYAQWNFSQPIYVNTTPYGAGVTDTVTNFPVLVRLSPTTFAGFSNTEPAGADIRFAKSDGTHLAYEIERWADGPSHADTAEIWVKVDSVFGNSDDKYFTMYWGRTGAADSSNASVVFDTGNGFIGVYHFAAKDSFGDATYYDNDGTNTATTNYAGLIGTARDFNGTSAKIAIAGMNEIQAQNEVTISCWNYMDGTTDRFLWQTDEGASYGKLKLWFDDNATDAWQFSAGNGTTNNAADGSTATGGSAWVHVCGRYKLNTGLDIFVNGDSISGTTYTVLGTRAVTSTIGSTGSGNYWDGRIDEVRVSKVMRSKGWIKLEYENQKLNQTLLDLENYDDWAYSQQIDINTSSTGAAVATAQTDFPLLVRLHKGNFTFTQAATGGADIRFADADGSHLAYEIERWDATNQAAEVWVKVPQITGSSSSDYVTMYWGRSGVSSKSNGAAVFDTANGYAGVWHMSGDPSAGNITDVSSNSFDGVPANMVSGDSVSGVVGAALNFDGSTKYLNIGANSSILQNVGAATLSAWVNLDALPSGTADYQIIHTSTNASATSNRAVLQVEGADSLVNVEGKSADGDGNQNGPSVTKMSSGSWTFVTGTFDYPNDQIKAYLNGALDKTTAVTFGANATSDLVSLATFIGCESATTKLTDGRIDEVVVSKSLRSADWIKLTYETQKATSAVLDFENYAKWPYSRQLSFNTTSSSGGADISVNVTDFPMLVRLHSGNFNFDLSSSDGSDIRFADPDGSHLHYEVERWDAAVDSAEVWVRVPQVDANSTSDYITMYWGLTGVPSRSNGKAVFDTAQGFAATYHLPSTNSYNDATGNLNNLTASASAPTEAGGIIGKGRAFASASSQRLYINDNASVSLTGNITYSTWAKFTNLGTFRGLISKGLTESRFVFDDTYNLRIAANNTQYTSSSASSPSTDTWYHLSAAFNNTGDTVVFYVDGNKLGSTVAAAQSPPDGTNALNIGADQSDDYMNGALDEPRLERSYRSADWIKLCYKTQKAPDSVIDHGTSNGNWTYSKKIWFNTTSGGANVRTNVSNFPTLVRLNSTNFNFDQAQSGGEDIRFADASGNQLAYELERWTSVNDSAEIWVKVPLIKGDSRETYVTMQWGNATASSASNSEAVFDTGNGFVGVWHLNESGDGTAGEFEDATTLGHDGRGRTSNVPAQASGMIGYSQNFSVAGQGIIVPNTAYMGGFPELTISLWVKQRSSGVSTTYGRWLTYGDGNPYRYSHYTSGGTHRSEFGINGATWGATNNSAGFDPTTPVWRHMVATYDGSMRSAYRDGVNTDTATLVGGGAINASADSALIIGNRNVSGGVFNRTTDGFIDEVRLEKTARSDDWVKLCYENQRADQTLLDFEDYANWSYSKSITINTSGMGLTGNVTKFPLLVRLRHTDFTFSQSATPASGPDIRFAKPDGTHLSYEIERWVYNAGVADSADIWVLVDTVQQNSSSQYVKMHWGKSSVTSKSSSAAVFDTGNGFAGVWHLDETGTAASGDYVDATAENNNSSSTTNQPLREGGLAGGAQRFNGSSQYIEVPDDESIGGGVVNSLTYSLWFKSDVDLTTTGNTYRSLEKGDCYFFLQGDGSSVGTGGQKALVKSGGAVKNVVGSTFSLGGWHHIAATYNGTDLIYFEDGTAMDTTNIAAAIDDDNLALRIGSDDAGLYFDGSLDEVVVSSTPRSWSWIKLCYETQVIGGSAVSAEQEQLLPITVATTATQCSVYTDKWTLVFDKSTGKGGGIEILTDSSHALSSGQANQLGATQNLFYVDHAGTTTKATGAWTLLTTSGTGQAIAAIRQNATLANLPFEIDYTVHGSGKLFVKATAHNTTGSPISGASLRFMTERRPVTTVAITNAHAQAKLSPYVLMSSDSSGQFDLLLSPYTMWNSDSGFASNATVFDTSRSSGYAGYKSTSFALASGQKEIWEFMLDFSHKAWNDTSGVGKYASDYRRPDSLEFIAGVPVLEQAWENKLRGHWKLDEGTGDSLRDNSGNLKNGYKSGGTWTAGKWGNALNLTAAQKGIVAHHSDFSTMGTIMAWVKPSSTLGATSIIYGKYSSAPAGVKLIGDAGAPAFVINGSTVATASASIGTGVWHHVAVSFNSSAIQIYIDGRLNTIAASGPYSVTWPTTSVVLGEGFAGVLDDVRFYNEIISNSTIKSIYQRGYRSSQGIYQIRAENNNSAHFRIDGGTLRRSFPMFQIANYWADAVPASGCVALNGTVLSAAGGDYVATLDNSNNVLTIGINRAISTDSARIYIDDNSSSGVSLITPTKRMVWGTHSTPNSHFWVKNFSGNNFGASGDKQFFIDWKMDTSTSSFDGEIWNWKSSYTSAGASADTSSTGNLLPTTVDNDWGLGTFTATLDGTNWGSSNRDMTGAVPSYTVMDSSEVRVSFRLAPRTITKSSRSFSITTQYTIYPTGQIFRWDSLAALTHSMSSSRWVFGAKYVADSSVYVSTSGMRGAVHSTTGMQDFAAAFLRHRDGGGATTATPWNGDIMADGSAVSSRLGFRFTNAGGDGTNWTTGDAPMQIACYMDIQRSAMNTTYVDSVGKGVQIINAPIMSAGTLVLTSAGDLNGNGFNEREGAYVLQASNNAVNFRLPARGDTCRFNPAFRITNYNASNRPQYVFAYRGKANGDTVLLAEGYHFNSYLKKASNELIMQLDTVACDTMGIYISADQTLAVTMSNFRGVGGDGADTLFWRTESEQDNLGFNLYRRYKPRFLDSLARAADTTKADSLLDNPGRLLKMGKVTPIDTGWVLVNKRIIPGSRTGASYGPRDYRWIDRVVHNDMLYEYRLVSIDYNGSEEAFGPIDVMPRAIYPVAFKLHFNYPNPFRHITTIRYDLPVRTRVMLNIYTLQGRLVRRLVTPDLRHNPGFYRITWDGRDDFGRGVASGPYVYRIATPRFARAKMMILAR